MKIIPAIFMALLASVFLTGPVAAEKYGPEDTFTVNKPFLLFDFSKKAPVIAAAPDYPASAFLAECGRGDLPGGNAQVWNWQEAKSLGENYPLILAGGLSPDNAAAAIAEALPDAVDVCSGVELIPGRKDPEKVKSFAAAVFDAEGNTSLRRIFS